MPKPAPAAQLPFPAPERRAKPLGDAVFGCQGVPSRAVQEITARLHSPGPYPAVEQPLSPLGHPWSVPVPQGSVWSWQLLRKGAGEWWGCAGLCRSENEVRGSSGIGLGQPVSQWQRRDRRRLY